MELVGDIMNLDIAFSVFNHVSNVVHRHIRQGLQLARCSLSYLTSNTMLFATQLSVNITPSICLGVEEDRTEVELAKDIRNLNIAPVSRC